MIFWIGIFKNYVIMSTFFKLDIIFFQFKFLEFIHGELSYFIYGKILFYEIKLSRFFCVFESFERFNLIVPVGISIWKYWAIQEDIIDNHLHTQKKNSKWVYLCDIFE